MIYKLRVFFISIEFLIILISLILLIFSIDLFEILSSKIKENNNTLNYLAISPYPIAIWTILESRKTIQEDNETIRILTEWIDYGKLKIHIITSIIYSIIFLIISTSSSLIYENRTGIGLLLLITGLTGQLYSAASIFSARIKIKEIISSAKK